MSQRKLLYYAVRARQRNKLLERLILKKGLDALAGEEYIIEQAASVSGGATDVGNRLREALLALAIIAFLAGCLTLTLMR